MSLGIMKEKRLNQEACYSYCNEMDGIQIMQVVDDESPVYLEMSAPNMVDYSVINPELSNHAGTSDEQNRNGWVHVNGDLSEGDIADMIRLNEGVKTQSTSPPEPMSPDFKHLEKITPARPERLRMLSTKSLKKSFIKKELKRKQLSDYDNDDDAFLQPLRKKFKARLEEEERQFKILKKKKKKLELETMKLEKARLKQAKKLKREKLILNQLRTTGGLKRRGRLFACGENMKGVESDFGDCKKVEKISLKLASSIPLSGTSLPVGRTRSGRTRKARSELSEYVIHSKAANFVCTGGLDLSVSTPIEEETQLPIKKKDGRGRKKGWRKAQNAFNALQTSLVESLDGYIDETPHNTASISQATLIQTNTAAASLIPTGELDFSDSSGQEQASVGKGCWDKSQTIEDVCTGGLDLSVSTPIEEETQLPIKTKDGRGRKNGWRKSQTTLNALQKSLVGSSDGHVDETVSSPQEQAPGPVDKGWKKSKTVEEAQLPIKKKDGRGRKKGWKKAQTALNALQTSIVTNDDAVETPQVAVGLSQTTLMQANTVASSTEPFTPIKYDCDTTTHSMDPFKRTSVLKPMAKRRPKVSPKITITYRKRRCKNRMNSVQFPYRQNKIIPPATGSETDNFLNGDASIVQGNFEQSKDMVVSHPSKELISYMCESIKTKSSQRTGLSRRSKKPLIEELTELRTTWDTLMGKQSIPESASEDIVPKNEILGVENNSPPNDNLVNSHKTRKVNRKNVRKEPPLSTGKRRLKVSSIMKETSSPLKEKQNLEEDVRLVQTGSLTSKNVLTLPEVLAEPNAPGPKVSGCGKTLSNRDVKTLRVSLTQLDKEVCDFSDKSNIKLDCDKMNSSRDMHGLRRSRRNSLMPSAPIRQRRSSQRLVNASPNDRSTVESSRKSGRERKFTERMVHMMEQEIKDRKPNSEKMECYENLLKSHVSPTPGKELVSLQSKVEVLAKHFECPWAPGDLVWTRFGEQPFWPSIIIQDPFSSDEYSKVKCLAKEPQLFVHVQFLSKKGRRAWVPNLFVTAFGGLSELKSDSLRTDKSTPESTEEWAYKSAFITPDKMSKAWKSAVREGDILQKKLPVQRIIYMRRKSPLERYGDSSLLDEEITDIPDVEPPLPPPLFLERPNRKPRSKMFKSETSVIEPTLVESPSASEIALKKPRSKKIKTDEVVSRKPVSSEKIKKNSQVKNLMKPSVAKLKKHTKVQELATSSRDKRAQSEDSTSAFEKESNSSLEWISLETKRAKKIFFKGVGDEKICNICLGIKKEHPLRCNGPCQDYFHPSCLSKLDNEPTPKKQKKASSANDWICDNCRKGQNPCFVCKKAGGVRQMCLTAGCGRFYHHSCLRLFPQTKFNSGTRKNLGLQRNPDDPDDGSDPPPEILSCALHTCHTCTSDDPADSRVVADDKLVRCVKCPTAYHSGYFCVPAGTEVLTTSKILCGKHFEPGQRSNTQYHFNINWCFICCHGGSLICCDSCPSSFHVDCLKLKPPEGGYVCEECESGRFPLHGEIVWVKLGCYRWWPAKVLYPQEIPLNLTNMKRRQCEFAVQFYGSRDYQWVNRGRAFLYQEGDAENNFKPRQRHDITFHRALQEANSEYTARKEALSQRVVSGANGAMGKPCPYLKVKTNKYTGKTQSANGQQEPITCECDPNGESPCDNYSNCLNRMLLFECNPSYCPAGAKCMNQCFEKRQYPPLQVVRTIDKGWGLQSNVDLAKGQFIIEYVGEVIDEDEFKLRMQKKRDAKDNNYYFLTLDSNRIIDAGPRGNLARFMNHSCSPNCETQKWTVNGMTRVGLFALQDISKCTELTFNYNLDCCGDERKRECHCGASKCSGFIGTKPKAREEILEKSKLFKKSKRLKKSKKSFKVRNKNSESVCFKCGAAGELMICDSSLCSKVCHVDCAGLTSWPNEPWYCPGHHCTLCKKPTKRCCSLCSVGYCTLHTDGYIFANESGDLFCSLHVSASKPCTQSRRSSYINRKDPDEMTRSSNSGAESTSSKAESIGYSDKVGDYIKEDPDNASVAESTSSKAGSIGYSDKVDDYIKEDPDNASVAESTSSKAESIGYCMSICHTPSPSEMEVDDLVPATDFLTSNSPVIFTDPDGQIIEIDPDSFEVIEPPAVSRSPRKRTNIPRSKIFPIK